VTLLLFSSHILFSGSQPTFKGRIVKLYPFKGGNIYKICLFVCLFVYFGMDAWIFILFFGLSSIAITMYFVAPKLVFNFLNFILLSHVVVCVAYSACFTCLFGLSFLPRFTLSAFKPLDSVLLLWLACKVIFIVKL